MSDNVHGPIGVVTQHVSGDEDGPTVGWAMNLGRSHELWCGELSKRLFRELPIEHQEAMHNDFGWFLVLFRPEPVVLGKAVDEYRARELVELIGHSLLAGKILEP